MRCSSSWTLALACIVRPSIDFKLTDVPKAASADIPSSAVTWMPGVQVPQVERFLVVHGQVVLNQFKNYPLKAVREAAFVGALRERMAQRRHHKLYAAPKHKGRTGGRWAPGLERLQIAGPHSGANTSQDSCLAAVHKRSCGAGDC